MLGKGALIGRFGSMAAWETKYGAYGLYIPRSRILFRS
jgi:hypothetical protein